MTRFLQWLRVALMLNAPSRVKRIRVIEENGAFYVEMHPSGLHYFDRPIRPDRWVRLGTNGEWVSSYLIYHDKVRKFAMLSEANDAAYRAAGRTQYQPTKTWTEFDV